MVCRCVWSRNVVNEEVMAHWSGGGGLLRQNKKFFKVVSIKPTFAPLLLSLTRGVTTMFRLQDTIHSPFMLPGLFHIMENVTTTANSQFLLTPQPFTRLLMAKF